MQGRRKFSLVVFHHHWKDKKKKKKTQFLLLPEDEYEHLQCADISEKG